MCKAGVCRSIGARQTAIGLLPNDGDLDVTGLSERWQNNVAELLRVDTDAWKAEVPDIEKHFGRFGDRLPARLQKQLEDLKARLG